jgi:polyferredoxin
MRRAGMGPRGNTMARALFFLKRKRVYPLCLQLFLLGFLGLLFCWLAAGEEFAPVNPGTVILWHIWWPFIPFLIFFLGRIWCTVCPFGAVAAWLNQLFPQALLPAARLTRYRIFCGVVALGVIVALEGIFALGSNRYGSLLFLSTMFGVFVLLTIIFDRLAFCDLVCPFGLFARLYKRLSMVEIRREGKFCDGCRRTAWAAAEPVRTAQDHRLDPVSLQAGSTGSDWHSDLECFAACPDDGARLQIVNPLARLDNAPPGTNEGGAAAAVIAVLAISAFFRSPVMTRCYLLLYRQLDISFALFQAAVAVLVVLMWLGLHGLLARTGELRLGCDRRMVLQSFGLLLPLLLFFHFAVVIKDVRGVTALAHTSSLVCSLDPHIPKKNVVSYLAYGLTVLGIGLSLLAVYRWHRQQRKQRPAYAGSLVILLLVVICNGLLALTTVTFMPYFG